VNVLPVVVQNIY